jgi:hypothetical protein
MTDSTWELLTNPADPRHGTITAYIHHGCRCEKCKAANRRFQQEARERRGRQEIPEHVHGTENGYTNYRCRCAECKAAHAKTAREKNQ